MKELKEEGGRVVRGSHVAQKMFLAAGSRRLRSPPLSEGGNICNLTNVCARGPCRMNCTACGYIMNDHGGQNAAAEGEPGP